MLGNKAIVYEGLGADPEIDRCVLSSRTGQITIVAVGESSQVPQLAQQLARQGARLIELCGGMSPALRPKVASAIGEGVRVSSVTFGIESIQAAANYADRFAVGQPPKEAFIILNADADPQRDRFVKAFPPQETTFVPVPDENVAARIAAELAETGYGLIELYGGFSSKGAAAVIEAVRGRAPVGVGSFTLEALEPLPQ